MAALIPDGNYTITNVATGGTLRLFAGLPEGLILAQAGAAQQWTVANVGAAGDQITLQSVANPLAFATANTENLGAGISGSAAGTQWTVERVNPGQQVFRIRSLTNLLLRTVGAQVLLAGNVGNVIASPAAQWTFA